MLNISEQIKNYEDISCNVKTDKEKIPNPKDMHRAMIKCFQESLKWGIYEDEIIKINSAKEKYDKNGDSSDLEELYKKIFKQGDIKKKGKSIDIKA